LRSSARQEIITRSRLTCPVHFSYTEHCPLSVVYL